MRYQCLRAHPLVCMYPLFAKRGYVLGIGTIQYNKQGRRKSVMIVIMNVCMSGHVTIVLKPQNKIYIIIVARTGGACRMLRITERIAESIERISIVHTKCPFRREQIL